MTYTEDKRQRIAREANRLSTLIEQHAADKHVAWTKVTADGRVGFEHIVLGATAIVMELITPKETCDERDLLLMLSVDRLTAQEMCESYLSIAKLDDLPKDQLANRLSPVTHYLQHMKLVPHLSNMPSNPSFDCNRLAVEAVDILARFLPKV